MISFDLEGVCQIEQSSEETSLSASANRALVLFHELCERVNLLCYQNWESDLLFISDF